MPTIGNFMALPPNSYSDGSIMAPSAQGLGTITSEGGVTGLGVGSPHICGISKDSSPGFGEARSADEAERILLGRGSFSTQSVVGSTDDGTMTPTADDSHSESSHLRSSLAAEDPHSLSVPHYFHEANTHNTALADEKIPNIEIFASDLQLAIDAAWPVRARSQYNAVNVLMLSWEDGEPGLWADMQRLSYVFENLYHFGVGKFSIPRSHPEVTKNAVQQILGKYDGEDKLLIVYYAGRAISNRSGGPPIWVADDSRNSPTMPSANIQRLFDEAASDILFLFESCYSANTISHSGKGVTEVLAACGMDHQAPIRGPHSFTNILVKELEEAFTGSPISAAELHGRILNSSETRKPGLLRDTHGNLLTDEHGQPRYEIVKKTTPVHVFLTNDVPRRSILLSPLREKITTSAEFSEKTAYSQGDHWEPWCTTKKSKRSSPTRQTRIPAMPTVAATKYPRVLLSVRLEENCFPDMDCDADSVWDWAEWLRDIPSGPEPVAIEAVYRSSSSTTVLLRVPLLVWHMLPSNAAYSFVGFVDSGNLQDVPDKSPPASSRDVHVQNSNVKPLPVSVHDIDIEKEICKRVEVELAMRELALLRTEKEEWQLKLEIEKEAAMAKALAMPNPFSNKRRGNEEIGWIAKAPIRFMDAVGRKFSFPFHLAATWNGVEELIRQAFLHVDVLGPHVNEGHYDLVCSSGGLSGEIIVPQAWETIVEPGWQVTMHMWPLPEPPKPAPLPPRYPVPQGPNPRLGANGRPPQPPQPLSGLPVPPGQAVPWPSSSSTRRGEAPPPPLHPGGLHSPTPAASGRPWVGPPPAPPGITIVNKNKSKAPTPKSRLAPRTTLLSIPDEDDDEVIIREERTSTRSRGSSYSGSDCGSERGDTDAKRDRERDEAIALVRSMLSAKRIFVVGRVGSMGNGRQGLIELKVKLKGEGMQMLNEYGRMFVEKVRRMKVEKGKVLQEESDKSQVLADD